MGDTGAPKSVDGRRLVHRTELVGPIKGYLCIWIFPAPCRLLTVIASRPDPRLDPADPRYPLPYAGQFAHRHGVPGVGMGYADWMAPMASLTFTIMSAVAGFKPADEAP
jgi:hypothetical protein